MRMQHFYFERHNFLHSCAMLLHCSIMQLSSWLPFQIMERLQQHQLNYCWFFFSKWWKRYQSIWFSFKTQYQVYTWPLSPSYLNTGLKLFISVALTESNHIRDEATSIFSNTVSLIAKCLSRFRTTVDATRAPLGLRIPHPRVAIIFPHWDSFRSRSSANNEICRLSS